MSETIAWLTGLPHLCVVVTGLSAMGFLLLSIIANERRRRLAQASSGGDLLPRGKFRSCARPHSDSIAAAAFMLLSLTLQFILASLYNFLPVAIMNNFSCVSLILSLMTQKQRTRLIRLALIIQMVIVMSLFMSAVWPPPKDAAEVADAIVAYGIAAVSMVLFMIDGRDVDRYLELLQYNCLKQGWTEMVVPHETVDDGPGIQEGLSDDMTLSVYPPPPPPAYTEETPENEGSQSQFQQWFGPPASTTTVVETDANGEEKQPEDSVQPSSLPFYDPYSETAIQNETAYEREEE